MKGFRKSTRIVYWILRALALSSALLLFSVTGIVALQTATHATGLAMTTPTMVTQMTTPPSGSTPITTPLPVASNTPTLPPTTVPPTAPPTQTPVSTRPIPTKVPQPTPTMALPTATVAGANPPVIVAPTATSAAIGPVAPLTTPTVKGSKKKPTPTPSPTPAPTGTATSAPSQGLTPNFSNTPADSHNDKMAGVQQFLLPAAGISTTILLASAGLLGLMFWRKQRAGKGATPQLQSSLAQGATAWQSQQAMPSLDNAEPAGMASHQNSLAAPLVMQSIAQYATLFGPSGVSQLDTPVRSPLSDFRPLSIDYPQLMEVDTDKTAVPFTPATLPTVPTTAAPEERQPVLQLVSNPFSPLPPTVDVSPMPTPAQTPQPEQQKAPVPFQFPPYDPFMENLMHRAQMGIFALPGKDAL